MAYLPKGAQFIRAKFLWEIGLHIAGDPATPYTGNRDLCITVGSGSGPAYRPWLRMSVGSPVLAHAVARGELEVAMVNPSALLTQAVRGKGLFDRPLPLVIVANYPSWDRFAIAVHPRSRIGSLADVAAKQLPLRLSTREDPTHSTRDLIDQLFAVYGFSLQDLLRWGGSLQTNGGPGDPRRLKALRDGAVDAVMDEGLALWFEHALAAGYRALPLEAEVFARLGAYRIVGAIKAREREIVWEDFNARAPYAGIGALGMPTEATPRDVPLHPGSARWFREHGFQV
jgi:TRAP-type uncharacterized transport system substrate-binding protein